MSKIKHLYEVSRLRELFSYDPLTGILTRLTTRHAGKPCGTLFNTGHLQVGVDGRMTGVHRIAWALHSGQYPTIEVDHINGDGSDNRLCNLRLATSSQNNQNRRLSTRNKTGVKGVFRVKRGKPWRVSVCVNGKYHITQFDDLDEAKQHACDLRQKLHHEFANTGEASPA
jgi:hypothetical protein